MFEYRLALKVGLALLLVQLVLVPAIAPERSTWSLLAISVLVLVARWRRGAVLAAGLMLWGLIATRPAAAGTVTLTGDPVQLTWAEVSGATGNVTFTVINGTGGTVELFAIAVIFTASGDALLDKADFGLTDTSNCRNNSSRLVAGASCVIVTPYTVVDKDPTDAMNPVDDTGVFTVHGDVAYGPIGGPASAHAVSAPDSVITVSDVPEPSTLCLCACGMLGLIGVMNKRSKVRRKGLVCGAL